MPDTLALLAPLPPGLVGDFPDLEVVPVGPDDDDPTGRLAGARIAVTDWSGRLVLDRGMAAALAPTCELVQVPAAGHDSIDLAACRDHGLPVATCAGLNRDAVAEWVVWAAIDALRGLTLGDRRVRDGAWPQLGESRRELAGRTVGLVGLGAVGTAAAERLSAFDVDLAYWSRRRRDPAEEDRLGVEHRPLDDLVASCDVLALAVALTPATRGLLSAERIGTMRPDAVVVNAARGGVVDEAALAAAVDEGRLHAATLDVLTVEPPPPDHPLVGRERVTVTPHIAGSTDEAVGRIVSRVRDNIGRVLAGREPRGLI